MDELVSSRSIEKKILWNKNDFFIKNINYKKKIFKMGYKKVIFIALNSNNYPTRL